MKINPKNNFLIVVTAFCSLINSHNIFCQAADCDLVDISTIDPRIEIRMCLATNNNCNRRPLYKHNKAFAQRPLAYALKAVQDELELLGLRLVILDAYRPLSVQRKLWKRHANSRYVANPAKGSRHNRGAAVDVRLRTIGDNKLLNMPSTRYGPGCHRDYATMKASCEEKIHCKLLELIMEKHGLQGLKTEWWHFDYKDWKNYELMDISIENLVKRSSKI